MSEEKRYLRTALFSITGGTAGGIVGKIVEFPLDTIKVRLQTGTKTGCGGRELHGPWDCFKDILKHEGPRGFYKGLMSPIFGSAFENASLFLAYGQAKLFLCKTAHEAENPPAWKTFLAGSFSGIWSGFILTPIELIKCKLQIQQKSSTKQFTGSFDCARHILNEEGFGGLFRGLKGFSSSLILFFSNNSHYYKRTLLREAPGNGFWFLTYVTVSKKLNSLNFGDIPSAMLSGCCAGIVYWGVPYPLDVIKSRVQTSEGKPLTLREAAKSVYHHRGFFGFYRGIGITLIRAAPASAVIFATDHFVEEHLERIF